MSLFMSIKTSFHPNLKTLEIKRINLIIIHKYILYVEFGNFLTCCKSQHLG